MRYCLLFCIVALRTTFLFAQEELVSFTRIPTTTGLSNSWIRSIYHDERGFIWTGTADGLNRFDGYEFKTYRPNTANGTALGHIQINSISKKSENELWICTSRGLYIYNYITDKLSLDKLFQTSFISNQFTDSFGIDWFATGKGLITRDSKKANVNYYEYNEEDSKSLSNNFVYFIYEDSDRTIWVGTQRGLNKFNRKTKNFEHFFINIENQEIGAYIIAIAEDDQKRLWVGTSQDGVYLMPRKTENSFDFILPGFVAKLIIDADNILWVAKGSGEGLDRLDINTFVDTNSVVTNNFKHSPNNLFTLSDNSLYTIYEDRFNDIWIGTYGNGLNYMSKRRKKFYKIQENSSNINSIKNNLVTAFTESKQYLWLGTEGGVDRYDKNAKTFKHFQYNPNEKETLGSNPLFSLYTDSNDVVWAGTWGGGLNKYDATKEVFQRYLPNKKKPSNSVNNPHVFAILEDENNDLLVGTIGGGLNKLNNKTDKFSFFLPNKKDRNSIASTYVEQLYKLKNGDIYLVSNFELQKYDTNTNTFKKYYYNVKTQTEGKQIVCIYEDINNTIWVGTNVGLYHFNPENGNYTHYNRNDKINNCTIQGILEDKQGNIWLSSNKGIFRIMNGIALPEVPLVHHFTETDGLTSNEFKKRAAFKNEEGKMYFGSAKGATWFYPEEIVFNTIPPKIVFTEFQLLENNMDAEKKYQSTAYNLNSLDEIDLSHTQSDFKIKYAALNYLNSEKNQYKYMLEGHDTEWIDGQGKRNVTYTNIQPGTYTFKVKGSNNDNIWSDTPKQIKINIQPPWWGTLLFKIILCAILISILFLTYLIRTNFLKKQNHMLEQKVTQRTNELTTMNALLKDNSIKIANQNDELENHRNHLEKLVHGRTKELELAKLKAEESDRLKSSFIANMSHEIRTPMNAIYGFSSLLDDELLDKSDRKEYLSIVKDNCDNLLFLIDNILDMSMMDANQARLNYEKFDVCKELSNLQAIFQQNNSKSLAVHYKKDTNKNELMMYSDRTRIHQVLSHLLQNAIKFTDNGSVVFGLEDLGNRIRFYVKDTGIGISEEKIETIFNPFYRIVGQEDKLYSGTGVGLAICKKIVNQLKGKIWVNSTLNKGSTFTFEILKESKV